MTQTNAHVAIMHASSTRHGSPTNPRYANTTKNTLTHLAYHLIQPLTCVPNFPYHARACPVHYHYAMQSLRKVRRVSKTRGYATGICYPCPRVLLPRKAIELARSKAASVCASCRQKRV
ncbi:hypothetical protein HBI56_052420 [Parastagonospora nodorum]|nr:hypothetical protein HBH53_181910 [Parastagonospora nodorum]KAH3964553.1 hypothetical protein HBH51_158010 [Parastagonospora nodorum]KAH3981497.1 hypothetical protein HBH52_087580 [Parastagonospora nodorum]KAH4022778.1 hypothetical protein HBI09_167630 [Parastagonospora nodorum]KAH4159830.1 hypothetical protein HBH43_184920 [Parastagonospora nodorum]